LIKLKPENRNLLFRMKFATVTDRHYRTDTVIGAPAGRTEGHAGELLN
jgi:hypothetical protein